MYYKERLTVPLDQLNRYIELADKINHGDLFPHIYINSRGQKCYHLSEWNTDVSMLGVILVCPICGKDMSVGMLGMEYCDCVQYPLREDD